MWINDSSFKKYKVYADIRWAYSGRGRQTPHNSGVVDDDIFGYFGATSSKTLQRRPALSADKDKQESRACGREIARYRCKI